jgi:hypothetical protein
MMVGVLPPVMAGVSRWASARWMMRQQIPQRMVNALSSLFGQARIVAWPN